MADRSETGYRWQLAGLWIALAGARWLAALPISEPRIFQDELLHWHMAKAYALHQPVVLFGHSVDYPAVLYPALLSLVVHVANARVAFDLARGLNALLMSAVVFPTYGLARELGPPSSALAAAAVAGLAPGGIYSALIMEESLYYPLFVLSCWLCYRVLSRGSARDAVACSIALGLTYVAKPLVLPLVLVYGIAAVGWTALELRGSGDVRAAMKGFAVRAIPLLLFAAVLLGRHAIVGSAAGPRSASEVLLSRFYAAESQGPLLPPIVPFGKVVVALCAALALGTGVTPVVTFLSMSRPELRDRGRASFLAFTGLVVGVYLLAIARHTLIMNDVPRPHERYLFPAASLLVIAFFTEPSPAVRRTAVALVLAAILVTMGPLGQLMLTNVRTIDAPSLTAPWLVRRAFGPVLAVALVLALALLVTFTATRRGGWVRVASVAALPLLCNVYWYRDLYSQTYLRATSRVVHNLEQRVGPTQRITVIIQDRSLAFEWLTLYLKFWLGDRVTAYWAGEGASPWYTDVSGPLQAAVRRAATSYMIGGPGLDALCPLGRPASEIESGSELPITIFEVPEAGCEAQPDITAGRAQLGRFP